jgi:hypothetical protein
MWAREIESYHLDLAGGGNAAGHGGDARSA